MYFDAPSEKALRENIDGVDKQEKSRMRRCNDDSEFLWLEKKSQVNGLCNKQTARIPPRNCSVSIMETCGGCRQTSDRSYSIFTAKCRDGDSARKPLWTILLCIG
ncbi:MAG: VTC domain-containing protein [Clostridiales bacterium]|nr:VTC domain-containing protein [Clostridiales bacterium]